MNIKKTSLIALIALLTCDVHASTASVARAGAKRIGTTGNRATVGGKAVSLSGGSSLNKLQSNRVQSGYSPVVPTDKSNEILEAMYDEMQKVQDTFTARIEQLEKTIEAKEAEIDELKEELENTQESVQEIADGGFITEEMVAAQIDDAKAEITNARNAALKSYATSADVSSAVTAAKTEAIAVANTAIEAESAARSAIVEKLATKEELENLEVGVDEERLKGIIDTELKSKDYATTTQLAEDIDAAKAEITNARNTALESYATSEQVSSAVTTAKNDAIAAANTAIEAESAARSAIVETLATKKELQELEVGVDEEKLKGIIDTELKSKDYATTTQLAADINAAKAEITTARNTALESYATSADVSSAVATLATKKELQELEAGVDEERLKGIIDTELKSKDYATTTQLAADIDAAKTEITTARNTALESYATSADVSSAVATLATKKELQDLEVGVDEERLKGIIDTELKSKDYATTTQLAEDIDAAKAEITTARNTALESYATSADVSSAVATLATKKELQELEVGVDEEKLKGIIDTELKSKDYATTTQLAADINAAKDEITTARNTALESYATKGDVDTDALTGKLSGKFVLSNGLSDTIKGLSEGGKPVFATTASVETSFSDIGDTIADTLLLDEDFKEGVLSGLSTELKELPSRVADLEDADYLANKLGNTFVKPTALTNLATKDDLSAGKLAESLKDTFVKPSALNEFVKTDEFGTQLSAADLSQNNAFRTLSGNVTTLQGDVTPAKLAESLKDTFVKPTALTNLATKDDLSAGKLAESLKDTFVKPSALNEFVKTDEFGTQLSAADLSQNNAFRTLSGNVTTLQGDVTPAKLAESLKDTFVKPSALTNLATKGDVDTDALTGKLSGKFVLSNGLSDTIKGLSEGGKPVFATTASVETSFSDIGDTIADTLLLDEDFKEGVLSGLSTELQELPGKVADLEDADYLANKLGTKFVKPADFGGLLSKDSTFGELRGTVSGLGDTYATKEALDTVDGKFAGYVKGTDFDNKLSSSTVLDGKFVKDADLDSKLSNSETIAGLRSDLTAETTARKDAISGLDSTFVKDADLDSKLSGSATIAGLRSDLTAETTARTNAISGLATKEALDTVDGKFAGYVKGTDFDNKLSSSTVLDGKFVKDADLDSKLSNSETIAGLRSDLTAETTARTNAISGLATKEALDTVDGKFAGYVKGTDFDTKLSSSTVLDDKFVKGAELDSKLSNSATIAGLRSDLTAETTARKDAISGLDTRFVKDDDLENTLNKKGYLVITELDKELTNLAENKDSTFGKLTVTADEASGRISTLSGNVDKLSGKYTTLNTSVGKLQTDVNNMPSTVIGSISDPRSDNYIGQWKNKTDGKYLVVTSDNVSKHLDDKKQPIFMTKDSLGTGIDNLLKDTSVKTGLHTLASNVSGLDSRVQGINSSVGTLQTNVSGLSSSLDTLSGKAVTDDNLGDKLQGNPKFTALSNSVSTLNSTAVTKSKLTEELYNKLTEGGTCGASPTPTDQLKSLLNGTFEVCTFKPKQ